MVGSCFYSSQSLTLSVSPTMEDMLRKLSVTSAICGMRNSCSGTSTEGFAPKRRRTINLCLRFLSHSSTLPRLECLRLQMKENTLPSPGLSGLLVVSLLLALCRALFDALHVTPVWIEAEGAGKVSSSTSCYCNFDSLSLSS